MRGGRVGVTLNVEASHTDYKPNTIDIGSLGGYCPLHIVGKYKCAKML